MAKAQTQQQAKDPWIKPKSDKVEESLLSVIFKLLGILNGSKSVIVSNESKKVAAFLIFNESFYGAKIVGDMEGAGGLNAGENSFHISFRISRSILQWIWIMIKFYA